MQRAITHALAGAAGWALGKVADLLLGRETDEEYVSRTSMCRMCGPVCLCRGRGGSG